MSPNAYDDIATDDYRKADENCPVSIRQGFDLLAKYRTSSAKYADIQAIFGLCDLPTAESVQALIGTLDNSLGTMAMVDYPYPTDFIEPLPGYPINVACQSVAQAMETHQGDEDQALYAIAAAGTVFYNYAG